MQQLTDEEVDRLNKELEELHQRAVKEQL